MAKQKALIIKTDGTHEIKEFFTGCSYEVIRDGVGGFIECVNLGFLDWADMWVNEEGKLDGLPLNSIGTTLWVAEYGPTDVIVGDIVITGGPDAEGNTTGLSEMQLSQLLRLIP